MKTKFNNKYIKYFFLLLTYFTINTNETIGQVKQELFYIDLIIDVIKGNKENVVVRIVDDKGKTLTMQEKKKFRLELELNRMFTITFSKPGYVTKIITVNTKVPDDKLEEIFDIFQIELSLFKQYDGINTVVFNQPIANIKYYEDEKSFNYDTDYTKSIQSKIEDAMKEITQKIEKDDGKTSEPKQEKEKSTNTQKEQLAKESVAEKKQPEKTEIKLNLPPKSATTKPINIYKNNKKDDVVEIFVSSKKTYDEYREILYVFVKYELNDKEQEDIVYTKVTYRYGDIFYFRNGISIHKALFDLRTSNFKL